MVGHSVQATRKLCTTLSKTYTGEVVVKKPAYVRDDGFVQVHVAELFHGPPSTAIDTAHPTCETAFCQPPREYRVQPVVRRCHHVARFVVHDDSGQVRPAMCALHPLQDLRQNMPRPHPLWKNS